MKWLIICVVIGLIIGLALGSFIFNFYVTSYPKASDTEKGLVGLVALFCVAGVTYLGYKFGESFNDP